MNCIKIQRQHQTVTEDEFVIKGKNCDNLPRPVNGMFLSSCFRLTATIMVKWRDTRGQTSPSAHVPDSGELTLIPIRKVLHEPLLTSFLALLNSVKLHEDRISLKVNLITLCEVLRRPPAAPEEILQTFCFNYEGVVMFAFLNPKEDIRCTFRSKNCA